MKKKIKKIQKSLLILKQPLFLFLINPLVLFLIAAFFTIFYNPLSSFTILVYPPQEKDRVNYPKGELTVNKQITGEFTARDNNLGIVSVRFDNFERISSDSVRFRIREKGKDWFYENTHKVNQFQPHKFFPFGFTPIVDSKGKRYQFEVISLSGRKGDAIGRSEKKPYFITSYQFPRHQILENKERFISYLSDRIRSITEYRDSLINALYYFLPFGYYYFIVLLLDRWSKTKLYPAFIFIIFVTLVDILLLKGYRMDMMLIISLLWVITFYRKRINGKILLLMAISGIVFIPIAQVVGREMIADKIARWVYVLLILGAMFAIVEKKRKIKINNKGILF